MSGERKHEAFVGVSPRPNPGPTGAVCGSIDVAARSAGPDWDHQTEDVFGPLREYNLRGLIEPRCPECGYRFDWRDLLDPRRRRHPYLFEHHAEKNFCSFWKTAIGGWRPRPFWTSLHPVQPSRPRRLMLYWCLVACITVLASQLIVALIGFNIVLACRVWL